MKKFFLIIFSLATILTVSSSVINPVYADGGCSNENTRILGMRPWFYGIVDDSCNPKNPADLDPEKGIQLFIMTIVSNIIYDIMMLGGIAAVAMIIYGGYQYLTAGGDAGKVQKGKKTITNAVVGLVIVLTSLGIMTIISDTLQKGVTAGASALSGMPVADVDRTLEAILQLVTGFLGVVAVASIVVAGIQYATSAGDAAKVQKAKNVIVYSVIGLVIALLAFSIITFVFDAAGRETTSYIPSTIALLLR